MTPLALAVMLAAAPDAGAGVVWRVTQELSTGPEVGKGRSVTMTTITPTEVRQSTLRTENGKRFGEALGPHALPPKLRDAITALLHKLPGQGAVFSTREASSKVVIDRDGVNVTFELVQGTQAPPLPRELGELLVLVNEAARPR